MGLFFFQLVAAQTGGDRPNILLIIGDDVGFSDLSPFGSEIHTPNLAALAGEGVIFTNYHTPPACSPTRAQLHTGLDHHRVGLGRFDYSPYSGRDGLEGYEGYLLRNNVTTAELLRDAGYHTYVAGKWHQGHEPSADPYRRGFEESFVLLEGGANHYNNLGMLGNYPVANFTRNGESVKRVEGIHSDRYWTDELIRMLDSHDDDQPFFAVLGFQTVHFPLQAPQAYIDKYVDSYEFGWQAARIQRYENLKKLGILTADHDAMEQSIPPQKDWGSLSEEDRDYAIKRMAIYAAMVEHQDYHIGRLVSYLEARGEFDNTIVIYVSDNGGADTDLRQGSAIPAFGGVWFDEHFNNSYENIGNASSNIGPGADWAHVNNAPNSWQKLWVYEGGTRVPLIVRHPDGAFSGASDALSQPMDVAATILDAAGVEHPGTAYQERSILPLQGRSLLPILNHERARIYEDDEPIVIEFLGNSALLMGDWKLVRIRSGMRGDNEWHLYHVRSDPEERYDLREARPEVYARLLASYRAYADKNNLVPVADDWVLFQ